jgi:hypothetical protein
MQLRALVVIVGLLAACASQADQAAPVEQVQPAPYQSQHGVYFKVVDSGSTYMQQLFEHTPSDGPIEIGREVERWRTADGRTVTDYYLVAPSPRAAGRGASARAHGADRG